MAGAGRVLLGSGLAGGGSAAVQWGIELCSHEVHSLDCPQTFFLRLLKRNLALLRQIIFLSRNGEGQNYWVALDHSQAQKQMRGSNKLNAKLNADVQK